MHFENITTVCYHPKLISYLPLSLYYIFSEICHETLSGLHCSLVQVKQGTPSPRRTFSDHHLGQESPECSGKVLQQLKVT